MKEEITCKWLSCEWYLKFHPKNCPIGTSVDHPNSFVKASFEHLLTLWWYKGWFLWQRPIRNAHLRICRCILRTVFCVFRGIACLLTTRGVTPMYHSKPLYTVVFDPHISVGRTCLDKRDSWLHFSCMTRNLHKINCDFCSTCKHDFRNKTKKPKKAANENYAQHLNVFQVFHSKNSCYFLKSFGKRERFWKRLTYLEMSQFSSSASILESSDIGFSLLVFFVA